MIKRNYALCNGMVYKKAPEATHTFVYCSSVKDFLLFSLSNSEVANVLTPYITTVTSLLSNPACRLIKPITINYNLIEVLPPGTCFHIVSKSFRHHNSIYSGITPIPFVMYTYVDGKVPYPLPFVTGMFSNIL